MLTFCNSQLQVFDGIKISQPPCYNSKQEFFIHVSILRTLFLILLLTPLSTGTILQPSETPQTPEHRPLEGSTPHLSPSDTKTPQHLPSKIKRHSIPSPPSDTQTTPQLSASDERTLQREFLLQQFIHRLTTTPHQTILRTQVS